VSREVIELARRTVLTGWVLLIDERSSFTRILVAVMVSLAVLMLLLIKQPYRHPEDQFLAVSAQFMVLCSFVGASYIKAYEEVKDEGELAMAQKVFDFDSSDHIVHLLLVFTVLMVFPMLFFSLAYSIRQDGYVNTIRLRSTGKVPELTLRKGQLFHLFNSHIWGTGQVCGSARPRHGTAQGGAEGVHKVVMPLAGRGGYRQAPTSASFPRREGLPRCRVRPTDSIHHACSTCHCLLTPP
jgi:hypothetical protein